MAFPYEPRPGASLKEIAFDPRNWIVITITSTAMAVSMNLLIYLFCWWVFMTTGNDLGPGFNSLAPF